MVTHVLLADHWYRYSLCLLRWSTVQDWVLVVRGSIQDQKSRTTDVRRHCSTPWRRSYAPWRNTQLAMTSAASVSSRMIAVPSPGNRMWRHSATGRLLVRFRSPGCKSSVQCKRPRRMREDDVKGNYWWLVSVQMINQYPVFSKLRACASITSVPLDRVQQTS